jgi:hypothetical protein
MATDVVTLAIIAADYDGDLPLVSCICPTYARPPEYQHLLEEAIESFLRQAYPNKELTVLDDCPEQELVCDAPGVRVINMPERFTTLGDKYNAAVALSRGELIAPWEVDDISLPWRLSLSVERLGDGGYFNPRVCWFLDGTGLHFEPVGGFGHNLSLYPRSAFEAAGGISLDQWSAGRGHGYRAALHRRLHGGRRMGRVELPPCGGHAIMGHGMPMRRWSPAPHHAGLSA